MKMIVFVTKIDLVISEQAQETFKMRLTIDTSILEEA